MRLPGRVVSESTKRLKLQCKTQRDVEDMAIITFENSKNADGLGLSWVDEYYQALTPTKQKRFIDTYFLIKRGNQASIKGWICETEDFKLWVWTDALTPLVQAITHATEHECGIVCKFSMSKTKRLVPNFAVDSEIPALYSTSDKGFLLKPIF